MKRMHGGIIILLLICLISGLGLTAVAPVTAQANTDGNLPPLTGTYAVKITTHPQCSYDSKIGVEDLGNGKIRAFGSFDGIPLSAVGHQTGQVENGSIYDLKIDIPKLFNGAAKAIFTYQDGDYHLTAEELGTYNFNGLSGNSSARITGRRISTSLPTSGIADKSAAFLGTSFTSPLLWGTALIILLLVICFWKRSRKGRRPINADPANESCDTRGKPFPRTNLLIAVGLFIAALAARLPWLWEIP
ncbi:MAG: hypothetical protein H6Q64_1217, partial [Firmicutes bacterium]|nr:hypothetical protein [Bacillota bacterium]